MITKEKIYQVLYAHCTKCGSEKMKMKFSEKDGLVVNCCDCDIVVITLSSGESLDYLLSEVSKRGCQAEEHKEHDHKREVVN